MISFLTAIFIFKNSFDMNLHILAAIIHDSNNSKFSPIAKR